MIIILETEKLLIKYIYSDDNNSESSIENNNLFKKY